MPLWIHRTTKQILVSVPLRKLPEAEGNYIQDPDLPRGVPPKYLTISGDVVTEMTQQQKDAVDAAELEAARDNVAAQLEQQEDLLRAFALVVLDEINILRGAAIPPLSARTIQQLKTAMRNKLGS